MKNLKKIFALTFLLLSFTMATHSLASEYFIIDNVGAMTQEERTELDEKATEISSQHNMDVVFAYMADTGDVETYEYAENYYAEGAWSDDGILLLLNDDAREYTFYFSGRAKEMFSVEEEQVLWQAYGANETVYNGVTAYLTATDMLLESKAGMVAENTEETPTETAKEPIPISAPVEKGERLIDQGDVLSAEEEASLLDELNTISEKHGFDVAIATVPSLGGKSSKVVADEFFDANGYGMGNNRDGILFLLSPEERDWAISTNGLGETAFTSEGKDYIMEDVLSYLKEDDYKGAFANFAQHSDAFIQQAKTGVAYAAGNMPKETVSPFWIPGSLVIGAIISFFIMKMQTASLKSVQSQGGARSYINADKVHITRANDTFISKDVKETKRAKAEAKEQKSDSGKY